MLEKKRFSRFFSIYTIIILCQIGYLISLKTRNYISLLSLRLFFATLSLPWTYHQTNDVLIQTVALVGDCPTPKGRILHTGIFFVILYFLMKWLNKSNMSNVSIARYSFIATLLFFILNTSDTYFVTLPGSGFDKSSIFARSVDDVGCLNNNGVIIQAVVFLVILYLTSYYLFE